MKVKGDFMKNERKLRRARIFGGGTGFVAAALLAVSWNAASAQQTKVAASTDKPHEVYTPIPGFDTTSIDTTVDPCNDFYKFAAGSLRQITRFRRTSPRWTSFMRSITSIRSR